MVVVGHTKPVADSLLQDSERFNRVTDTMTDTAKTTGGQGLSGMLLPELREKAQNLGISGTSGMRKQQLISAIRDKQGPAAVLSRMRVVFPQYPIEQLTGWVKRFFRLWSRNQWKRERYAPSFHLDDENLDPKTWCRWPILSGGFEEELAGL